MLRRTLGFIVLALGLLVWPSTASAGAPAFGVHTPDDPFGGTTLKVDALQNDMGRPIEVVSWFQSWGGAPWVSRVQPQVFNAVIRSGRVPLVAWEPWAPDGGVAQPAFRLQRIVDGAFDDYIESWARALRGLHSRIYLRPMHEFNGNWYPWCGSVNGNSPELFKQAWRRMVDIFRREGAGNVKWVFTPINEDWPMNADNRFERFYPGRDYVDVLAMDGYNWGATKPNFGGWRSFRTTFSAAYHRLSRLGSQPIWIAEVGSATEGGDKAAWIRDMFRTARTMRRLRAVVWMDTIDPLEGDWRMRYPAGTLDAFRMVGALTAPRRLEIATPVRAGRRAVVRWSHLAPDEDVVRWRVYLNGKRVRTLAAQRKLVLRKRLNRVGRYRWTVRGIDVNGRSVISSSRRFRVVRAR
jgi:hypothetical protein